VRNPNPPSKVEKQEADAGLGGLMDVGGEDKKGVQDTFLGPPKPRQSHQHQEEGNSEAGPSTFSGRQVDSFSLPPFSQEIPGSSTQPFKTAPFLTKSPVVL
jgi:hypothetical protein